MNRQGFLKGSVILLVMVIVTKILGLMYKIPLTRLLGGTGMGYFSSAFSVFTPVMAIVVSGIPSSMSRLCAESYAFGRYRNLRKIKSCAMVFFGVSGLVAAFVMFLLSKPLGNGIIGESGSVYALMCVAPSVFFCTLINVERGYYEGLRNMYPTAISEIIETLFKLILGLGFAYGTDYYAKAQFSATGMCFGMNCSSIEQASQLALPFVTAAAILGTSLASSIACIYIIVQSKIRGDGITKEMLDSDKITDKTSRTLKILLKYSAPIAFIAVITTITNMIDMVTMNPCIERAISKSPQHFSMAFRGISATDLPNFIYGSYTGLAVTVFGLVPTLTAMLGKSLLPSLTESYSLGNNKDVSIQLNRMMTVCGIICIPSGLGISAFSEEILSLLFSGRVQEIQAAAPALEILGIGVIFMGLSLPCFAILQTLGKPSAAAVIMISGGVIKLVLNVLLIPVPSLALTGAAISTLVTNLYICVATLIVTYKLMGADFAVKDVIFKPLYCAVLCVVTALCVSDRLSELKIFQIGNELILLLAILSAVIIYGISLYLLCEMPKSLINYLFSKKNRKST